MCKMLRLMAFLVVIWVTKVIGMVIIITVVIALERCY